MQVGAQKARERNLGYWAHGASLTWPDNPAILDWVDGQARTTTHGELEARLQRAASMFSSWGLEPGARIAVGVGNRVEFIEIFFGAMRAGLVPVPLNLRQGRGHLEHVVSDSGAVAAIVEPSTNDHLPDLVDRASVPRRVTIGSDRPGWEDYGRSMAAAAPVFAPIELPADHPAFLAYTSGSTGRPKGVVLTHAGQVWWVRTYCALYEPQPTERSLVAVPLYHKNAMAGGIKVKLPGGGSVVLMPRFEARAFLRNLSELRCTHATGVPTIYNLAMQEQDLARSLDFSSLRSLTVGSAPVHDELHRTMEKTFGCPVFQSYGSTEGGPVVMGPPTDGRAVPLGSCGTLWPDGEAKLVDAEGREQERFGELWLRNPGVTSGYYNLPDVNAKRLTDGWLATGDLFEVDEGRFWYFRGRTDDMFDCGGENVFPKEVEDLLLTHPAVRDACVVPLVHPSKGHAPGALVVIDPDQAVTPEDLKAYALAHGPAYAHPRRILVTGALPLNGAGKVDRAAVTALMRDLVAETGPS